MSAPMSKTNGVNVVPQYTEEEKEIVQTYESAAKLYCKMLGADPDRKVSQKHPTIHGAEITIPYWHTKVPTLLSSDMVLLALVQTQKDRVTRTKPPMKDWVTGPVAN